MREKNVADANYPSVSAKLKEILWAGRLWRHCTFQCLLLDGERPGEGPAEPERVACSYTPPCDFYPMERRPDELHIAIKAVILHSNFDSFVLTGTRLRRDACQQTHRRTRLPGRCCDLQRQHIPRYFGLLFELHRSDLRPKDTPFLHLFHTLVGAGFLQLLP